MNESEDLALFGGPAVRKLPWPLWPTADVGTELVLKEVLYSGRWALSGAYRGKESFEKRFARDFANYCEVDYCVPTVNGTAALTIALLALGIGIGDEVLVPGLTWVACASAVMSVGATPILVDIEPATLAMAPAAARAAWSMRTAAILLVHPFCRIADIDAFVELCDERGVPLIEDCSQAHGAQWRGRKVGSFGAIGCFSMQQSKLLTSGEGGAVITSHRQLYERLQQLRADGRIYSGSQQLAKLDLVEVGSVQGQNFCLSEFQAALLTDRLTHLDSENQQRECFVAALRAMLQESGLAALPPVDTRASRYVYYNLLLQVDTAKFSNASVDAIARALTAELNVQVSPVYLPTTRHPLYNPLGSPRIKGRPDLASFDPGRFQLPSAELARSRCITIPNWPLLDGVAGAQSVHVALKKVEKASLQLLRVDQTPSFEAF